MNQNDLDIFFTELDKSLQIACSIILTGASAGMLMGHIRPSLDIDFEITPLKTSDKHLLADSLPKAINTATKVMPVAVDYSGDISHWSQISYLDYRTTAQSYKKIGLLDINIIAPEYWTIGKMTRFVAQDIEDIKVIITSKNIQPIPLINLWAQALTSSELSLTCSAFKRNVNNFINAFSKELWKKPPQDLIKHFAAKIDSN